MSRGPIIPMPDAIASVNFRLTRIPTPTFGAQLRAMNAFFSAACGTQPPDMSEVRSKYSDVQMKMRLLNPLEQTWSKPFDTLQLPDDPKALPDFVKMQAAPLSRGVFSDHFEALVRSLPFKRALTAAEIDPEELRQARQNELIETTVTNALLRMIEMNGGLDSASKALGIASSIATAGNATAGVLMVGAALLNKYSDAPVPFLASLFVGIGFVALGVLYGIFGERKVR